MRRMRLGITLVFLLLALAGLALTTRAAFQAARVNHAMEAMAAGRDIAVAPDAPLRLIEARAAWLLARDRLEQAEPLGPLIQAGGDTEALARWHFNRGNARLRAAFELISLRQLDEAIPQVDLAKAAFRAALRADPAHFGAKVNFELAQRLVRDLPKVEQAGEEIDAPPKALWTDLPGVPGGLP